MCMTRGAERGLADAARQLGPRTMQVNSGQALSWRRDAPALCLSLSVSRLSRARVARRCTRRGRAQGQREDVWIYSALVRFPSLIRFRFHWRISRRRSCGESESGSDLCRAASESRLGSGLCLRGWGGGTTVSGGAACRGRARVRSAHNSKTQSGYSLLALTTGSDPSLRMLRPVTTFSRPPLAVLAAAGAAASAPLPPFFACLARPRAPSPRTTTSRAAAARGVSACSLSM